MVRGLRRVVAFVRRPWTSLVVGVLMVAAAMVELLEDVDDISAEHGVVIFGSFHILRTLGELFRDEVTEVAEAATELRGAVTPGYPPSAGMMSRP